MSKWIFEDREKALEEAFFKRKEDQLLDQLRQKDSEKQIREKLFEVVGAKNEELVDHLVHIGIRPETWAAMALIPLIQIAWADGSIEEKEREAILDAAHKNGVEKGNPAHSLLEEWLKEAPEEEFFQTWVDYMKVLAKKLTVEKWSHLRDDILERTRLVSEAAGGILGWHSMSSSEEEVYKKIQLVFSTGPQDNSEA
jgi:2-hydroxy-3-keto-5-methylthiopentenyl-1-phosphate phosphatase